MFGICGYVSTSYFQGGKGPTSKWLTEYTGIGDLIPQVDNIAPITKVSFQVSRMVSSGVVSEEKENFSNEDSPMALYIQTAFVQKALARRKGSTRLGLKRRDLPLCICTLADPTLRDYISMAEGNVTLSFLPMTAYPDQPTLMRCTKGP